MSRNSRKFNKNTQEGSSDQAPDVSNNVESPPPEPTNSLFGLSFVVPTEEVKLPSEGKHYPENSPFYGVAAVEIKHMTSKEEDILSRQIEDGDNAKIYDKLIDSLLIDNSFRSKDLLEEDKLALILAARTTGYGPKYKTEVFCQNCQKPTKHIFDLTKTSFNQPSLEAEYDPKENVYESVLPKSKIQVKILPINDKIKEDIEIEKKQKKKYNLPFNNTVSTINKLIISANGVTDRSELSKLSEILPAIDAKYIIEFSNSARPSLSTKQEVKCSVCNTTSEQEAPITWAFFRTEF